MLDIKYKFQKAAYAWLQPDFFIQKLQVFPPNIIHSQNVCISVLLHVQSVFRNYDHDHDGYISQEDFESIAANFPFLDSFCVLDKDQ